MNNLIAKPLGIDTYQEAVVYLHHDCSICKSEGFRAQARVLVTVGDKSIIATLNIISNDSLLQCHEVGFSEYAWELSHAAQGEYVYISHPRPLTSLSFIRKKIYGQSLEPEELTEIVRDITHGRLSEIHISAFLASTAGGRLSEDEITHLTQSMTNVGAKLTWDADIVVDKHCVGGLPGNRVTPIIIPIVAEFGLLCPKTSSRAITSPAGTADTLALLTPVDLTLEQIQTVVKQENACMAWGGSVGLSPADDILIRVERSLNLDSEGQMIASVLSKKLAAGSTHVLVDIPIGSTVKVRSVEQAEQYKYLFEHVAKRLGLIVNVIFTDGEQPIGRGIGPLFEAIDILAVLQNKADAPQDLADKAVKMAGLMIEFSPEVQAGQGEAIAREILKAGRAWHKFKAICEAQGGLLPLPAPEFSQPYLAETEGEVTAIDNRSIVRIARLAGAPLVAGAGLELHVKLGDTVGYGQPLFTVYAQSRGELDYALGSLHTQNHVITIHET